MKRVILITLLSLSISSCGSIGKQSNRNNLRNSPIYNSYEYDLCYNDRFTGYYEECEDIDFDDEYEHGYYYY